MANRVQEETIRVSTYAAKLLGEVSDARKQAQQLSKLLEMREKRIQDARRAEEEKREGKVEAPVFMNAFSSDQFDQQGEERRQADNAARASATRVEEAMRAEQRSAAEAAAQPAREGDKPAREGDRPARGDRRAPAAQGQPAQQRPQPDRRQQGTAPRTPGDRPARPAQGPDDRRGQRPMQGDARPGQRTGDRQGPSDRPPRTGDRPMDRPPRTGDRQGMDRPPRTGDRGPQQRPFNRPGNGPAAQGRTGGPQQGQFNRGPRPQAGFDKDKDADTRTPARGRQGAGGAQRTGSRMGADITPAVGKERVSNYDPNKKNYVRQHDPEHVAKNRRQLARSEAPSYNDDDMVRSGKRKRGQKAAAPKPEPIKIEKAFMTAETITVRDLSERIGKPAGEIIKKLIGLDIMATINSELDYDQAVLICSDFGIELEQKLEKTAEEALSDEEVTDTEADLLPRPPVITIMGHVDHGKTSLLDYIRNSHVASGEAGGITQHIGAYTVDVPYEEGGEKKAQTITFLDTPGHEAFTAMRARGAQCTDIAILVVAADDGVMPQTIEAINHAKAANVPIIVAINKCDRPDADPDRIKTQMTEYGLVCEDWGGDTIMVPVSAKTGDGVDSLLDMIRLQAEVMDLKANPNRLARGIIVEAKLDKGRGPVATVLVQNGTLHAGDTIVAGTAYGRVRAMVNDRGQRVNEATPSMPVEVVGFNDVPEAGDHMIAVEDERLSRLVAEERKQKLRASQIHSDSKASLDDLFNQLNNGTKDLNLIVKADVQGSVEAVKQSLEKLSNDEVRVHTIHGAVGAINEGDVMLATASNAIIIGFNVRPDSKAAHAAERDGVEIRTYRVIYTAIEEIQAAMKGMLAPQYKENILGHAQVRQTFKVSGVGTIAGSYVVDGKIQRNAQVRLLRDNVVIYEGKISSLKRFKDDAREVATGFECGIGLENYNDVKENDVIECFIMEEIAQ